MMRMTLKKVQNDTAAGLDTAYVGSSSTAHKSRCITFTAVKCPNEFITSLVPSPTVGI